MMKDQVDRRTAIELALMMLGGAVITISGCGGGGTPAGPNPAPTPTPGPGDEVGTISGNHGHSAVITAADLTAGNGLTLHIRGNATHDHTIELSGTEVVRIRDGGSVAKGSTLTDSHTHTVTFN
jgi:hypothetical protein